MNTILVRLIAFPLLTVGLSSIAEAETWKVDPAKSVITFNATQNNAPVSGQFKKITGVIDFDPKHLAASKINVEVDMNSITTSYELIAKALKMTDWFNTPAFPKAIFVSNSIEAVGADQYKAKGNLTVRDKSAPVEATFKVSSKGANSMEAKGSTEIKRLQYGVGQGEWASTDEIKDNVKVDFSLSLIK